MLGAITLFNRLADHLALWLCTVGDGVDQRQCGFTFGEVVTYVLTQFFGVGSVVQQVIGQLEGGAQVFAIVGQRRFHFAVATGQHTGQTGCGFK